MVNRDTYIEAKRIDGGFLEGSFCFPEHSLVSEYLLWLSDECEDQTSVVPPCELRSSAIENAFITVIVRTQGNRAEALEETFLCLSGQSDKDFIVYLIGHNLSPAARDYLVEFADMQVPWLSDRIRVLEVEGGGRSRPLNSALSLVSTPYAVILDDDDIVFDNWISSFHEASDHSFGAILLSGVFTQEWAKVKKGDSVFLRAVNSPIPDYVAGFNPIEQLTMNHCPTMGWAFPSFVFTELGLRFDESLSTTEDWDFLMRSSFVCGVVETGECVAIYRLWKDSDTSHEVHNEGEWEKNRIMIQDKLSRFPLLFPAGFNRKVESTTVQNHGVVPFRADGVELYYSRKGEEARVVKTFSVAYDPSDRRSTIVFSDLSEFGVFDALSISLGRRGLCTLKDLCLTIETVDAGIFRLGPADLGGNGIWVNSEDTAFLQANPFVECSLQTHPLIKCVSLSFRYCNGVEEPLLTGTKLVVRAKEKVRKVLKKHHYHL